MSCFQTFFLLMFLLLSNWAHLNLMAEGRTFSMRLEVAQKGAGDGEEKTMVATRRKLIGSMPPRCDRKCSTCGHCKAIQVPLTAQTQSHGRHPFSPAALAAAVAYSRREDISNYKPISWKCKCGNFVFNP